MTWNLEIYVRQLSIIVYCHQFWIGKDQLKKTWIVQKTYIYKSWLGIISNANTSYSCFVKTLIIESVKCNYACKFLAELQLSFLVNFRSYVVLAHQVLPCIISIEDAEPIYWDNRNKTNQKWFYSNMKHFC